MKIKFHIGFVIILLALFRTYLEYNTVPNQQIVIQFSDKNVAEEDTKNTIEAVKAQLQSIGIEDIKINLQEKGQLKITYYSNSDVEHIQSVLTKADGLKFDYASNNNSENVPENKTLNNYKLNVSEIQNDVDTNRGIEGTQIVELHHKSDRFYNLKHNTLANHISAKLSNSIMQVALKSNSVITTKKTTVSYKTPEVRAGPITKGNA